MLAESAIIDRVMQTSNIGVFLGHLVMMAGACM